MSHKLHLFNPENDLALALGCRHYTPPPHASALHRAGALLPAWWVDNSDFILADADYTADAEWLKSKWGITCDLYDGSCQDVIPVPWGWSLDACRQFVNAGVDASCLPTTKRIEQMRQLSHRRSSIAILRALGRDDLLPVEFTEVAEAMDFVEIHPGCFMKSPWSCSGRGVFCTAGMSADVICEKVSGVIHRQGSIVLEHGFDKILDIAALFESENGNVSFRGFSTFVTEHRGMYVGNIAAPQPVIRDMINSTGMLPIVDSTVVRLEMILDSMLGDIYSGWLGVDMMVYRDSAGNPALHPCIELNLRTTMGVAAMGIAERLSLDSPYLLGWQRGNVTESSSSGVRVLLPPRDGFCLILSSIIDIDH